MTRIRLKPNSAEFADENERVPGTRCCDMPGCKEHAEHRAPKNRQQLSKPSDYYWFCLPHVQEYNAAWDYFSGMSASEVETHIVSSMYWDRPTRRFDGYAMQEELQRKAWQTYHYTDKEPPRDPGQENQNRRKSQIDSNSPEFQALAIMGLEPPVVLKDIKAKYKELVKLHHPDVNKGNLKSEELIKRINMAYTILKLAYEKFEKLPESTT